MTANKMPVSPPCHQISPQALVDTKIKRVHSINIWCEAEDGEAIEMLFVFDKDGGYSMPVRVELTSEIDNLSIGGVVTNREFNLSLGYKECEMHIARTDCYTNSEGCISPEDFESEFEKLFTQ